MSNRALHIRKHCNNLLTMRDVLGEKKGWPKGQFMLQHNGYGNVKSADHPSFTVTPGYLQARAWRPRGVRLRQARHARRRHFGNGV